ncbi:MULTISPECIES: glycerol-3-phosphate 1-O-acyltransferase PlsY [Methylobacterium]|uniref:Glycerol-3-phosphate acyltransferase n=1 Tax=Methylobacterium bullatum TaxID=570505 RepID=A0AAV4Z7D0_9HYPH|nr:MULTISPECIES: glycerol-3-phosphate 1-O-acyltransferase PlsY [Methylobacterium]MBD8902318.1 glycerol-3-phosphate acyltransferase [Methylobacterium bullatum]TXN25761.1 glycerol-3-phosphate 1-O-acyltransferase PlsY [Methylobacterium sp. WL19]GJD39608.1 Glycerol-3-phosphate acyltransferase [Methylobacterium bullatum]
MTLLLDAGWPLLLASLAGGYLAGSVPFGLIVTRFAGLGDVRAIGSGNIGATNVLRTGRKGLAAATLLGDALKGTLAVLVAARFGEGAALAAGLGAFLGHLFSVWLGFKGGKGVATFLGVLLAFSPIGLAAFAAIWLGLAFTLKYSSLAALAASAATPIVLWAAGQPAVALLFLVLAILLWWKHAPNIRRLLDGSEGRIGQKG